MISLLDRQKQIPNGMFFYEPATRWRSRPWASFDQIVNEVIEHRKANSALKEKMRWSMDYTTVANEVDTFNAKICEQMGWTAYIIRQPAQPQPISLPFMAQTQAPIPLGVPVGVPVVIPPVAPLPPPDRSKIAIAAASIKKIWSGVRTLDDWLDSGEPAVAPELSSSRAATCAACPKNVQGDFTSWFTRPASEGIRKQLERVQNRNLSTPSDDRINICDVCLCPLKLKVHTPFEYIKRHLIPDVVSDLRQVPNCWIIKELGS